MGRAGLLASYFAGVVSSGGGSPGRPLQPLGLFRQLCHRHALLLLHPDGYRIKQTKSHKEFPTIVPFLHRQLVICANVSVQVSPGTACSQTHLPF